MAVWTDLPLPILEIIAQYLTFIEDFVSFSAISKECRLITARLTTKSSLSPRYPRLMLAENKDARGRGFVNLLTSKTYGVELLEASDSYCVGAHYGWLFVLGSDLQINLLHPFSRQQIRLPSMLTFPSQCDYDEEFTPQMMLDVFVKKIATSASPLNGNNLNDECVTVAIYGGFRILAFARLRDTVWTNIQAPGSAYEDVIYYKGKFFAICHLCLIVFVIDGNNSPKVTMMALAPPNTGIFQKYIVESSGDLLLVLRERGGTLFQAEDDEEEKDSHYWEGDYDGYESKVDDQHNVENNVENGHDKKKQKLRYYTVGFSLYRIDESLDESSDYPYEYTEVTTLGDRTLFLGRNVSTSMVPTHGIKKNCIYFTDDDVELYGSELDGGGRDTGIFNVEDGNIQFGYAGRSRSKLSPPIWYI